MGRNYWEFVDKKVELEQKKSKDLTRFGVLRSVLV
jgi:hypothetical protein